MDHKIEFKQLSENVMMLTGPQLSFPSLWKPGTYEDAVKPNLDTAFILPGDQKGIIKQISAFLVQVAQQENPKITKVSQMKDPKLSKAKSEGEETGDFILKTSNSFDYPPKYVNLKGAVIEYTGGPTSNVPADVVRLLRAGNYVKVIISCNPQTIDKKVKVWTNIDRIQFFKTGPNLGGGVADELVENEFGVVEGDMTDIDESASTASSADVDVDDEFEDDEFEI